MVTSPKVAIILLNFNGKELLKQYLDNFRDLEYDNYNLILVDNNSSDNSVEYVKQNHPTVTVVESGANLGFSAGNNLGANHAEDADYYWFVNTDVRVTPKSLDRLVTHIDNDERVGIVVPRINDMDEESIQSLGYKYDIFGIPRAITECSEDELERPHPVTYGSGAALLIDTEVWNEIGGFDESNFMYGDDTYLSLNAWIRGYRVEVEPRSVVYHEEGASQSNDQGPQIAYHNARGRTRCYLLTLELQSILLGVSGFISHSLVRIAKDVKNSQFRTAASRTWGYITIVFALRAILKKRRRIQLDRKLDDEKFLSENYLQECIWD